ncbi:hypothetical protein MP638_002024 [Amoeboaphelidium occidentale]|nr:hypothetical protein MP638_002024 [Amoeboaphelidium occidentale]
MPTCVECGNSVASLYTEFSAGNIRLTQCEYCKNFADKYIEHDSVIIFIDMLLHKPQVYRHILFNQLEQSNDGIDPNVLRLGVLLILFDVYVKWFGLELLFGTDMFRSDTFIGLMGQYISILGLCIVEFIVFHSVIRSVVMMLCSRQKGTIQYNYISMALIISSFAKLLLILMIIWEYNQNEYSWLVSISVLTSNTVALSGKIYKV